MSISRAEGTLGSPGMVMMSPQIITTNSAPADEAHLAHVDRRGPHGAPRSAASVENEYWVFATQTG